MADNYVRVINTIKQQNDIDFGIIDSNDTIGGFYQTDTIEQRDAIPTIRRKEGMFCWVGGTVKKVFQLVDGITNDNWIEFKSGSSDSGGSTIDGYAHIWVGTEPPEDTSMIWLDTNSDGILDDESETDVQTVSKLLSRIGELENTVALLAKRVAYLEENGVVAPGGGGGTDNDTTNVILLEDGTPLLLEDGTPLLLESGDTNDDTVNAILLEDGTPLLLEDGTPLLLETSSSGGNNGGNNGGSSGGSSGDNNDKEIISDYDTETGTLTLESDSISMINGNLVIDNNNASVSNGNLRLYKENEETTPDDKEIISDYNTETRTLTLESSSISETNGNLIINNNLSVSDGNLKL